MAGRGGVAATHARGGVQVVRWRGASCRDGVSATAPEADSPAEMHEEEHVPVGCLFSFLFFSDDSARL